MIANTIIRTLLCALLAVSYSTTVFAAPAVHLFQHHAKAAVPEGVQPRTNAERLRRGLPPSHPVALFEPSKVKERALSRPSGTPRKRYCIAVKRTSGPLNGRFLGYFDSVLFQNTVTDPAYYRTYTTDVNRCLQVYAPSDGNLEIATLGPDAPYRYFGIAASDNTGPTASGRSGDFVQTAKSSGNNALQNSNSLAAVRPWSQSHVWTSVGGVLVATWKRSGIDTVLKFVRHSGTTSLAAKHLLDFNDAVDDVVLYLVDAP